MKKKLLLFAALIPAVLFGQIKIGETTFETLGAAGEAAVEGDVITVSGVINYAEVYGFKKNVTVKGITTDAQLKFAEGARLGFEGGATVTVENLTLIGRALGDRMMWVVGAGTKAIFKNDTIRDAFNTADHGGAFLLADASMTEAYNCVFMNNKARKNGGVFWMVGQSGVYTKDCLFLNNAAQFEDPGKDGKGACFAIVDANHGLMMAENCAFYGNYSEGNGGVLNNENSSDFIFVNCTMTQNHAGGRGGIINFWDKGTATLVNCTVYDNWCGSAGNGGAIYCTFQNNTVVLKNTVIVGNSFKAEDETTGPSNIDGNLENQPFSITAYNSFVVLPDDGSVSITSGTGNISSGETLLSAAKPDKNQYFCAIGNVSSVLVSLGNPEFLSDYGLFDMRGYGRKIVNGHITAGAYEVNAIKPDSIVELKPLSEITVSALNSPVIINIAEYYTLYKNAGVLGVYPEYEEENILTIVYNAETKQLTITKIAESSEDIKVLLVIANDEGAAEKEVELIVHTATSVKSLADQKIEVYPNPAANYIVLKNMANVQNVFIYNISGTLVKSVSAAGQININNLSAGMYYVTAIGNGATYKARFIKK